MDFSFSAKRMDPYISRRNNEAVSVLDIFTNKSFFVCHDLTHIQAMLMLLSDTEVYGDLGNRR